MKKIGFFSAALSILVVGFAQPSWAWRGGGFGWRGGGGGGGWGGPRVGVYVGGPYLDYPYYDPYYYPAAPYPYPAYPAYPVDPNAGIVPDNQATDNSNAQPSPAQISRQRAQLDYDYADGDITKAQYDAGIAQLRNAAQQAQNPTVAAPTRTTAASVEKSQPSSSIQGLAAVTDLHLELTTLLDQKLKDGDITRAQHDSEVAYLNQIDSEARGDANANNGRLTGEQEEAFIQQLHQAYYSINHNLITH